MDPTIIAAILMTTISVAGGGALGGLFCAKNVGEWFASFFISTSIACFLAAAVYG